MWRQDAGTDNQTETRVLPTAQELRTALTPPAPTRDAPGPGPILRTQLILCIMVLAVLAAGRYWQLPWFESCRAVYAQLSQAAPGPQLQGQLVRFAGALAEDVRAQAGGWLEQLPAPERGMGGLFPQKTRQLPPGYSLERYLPAQPMQQPVSGFWLSSGYGWRTHPISGKTDFHTGADLAAAEGTPVTAAQDGFVLDTGRSPSYGNYVLLLHEDAVLTRYCHMQYVFVRRGESIPQGGVLGTVGQTGVATGPHLHFELLHEDIHYDPAGALGL